MSLAESAPSASALPLGERSPRLLLLPVGAVRTDGDDAIALGELAGLILDGWQQDAVRLGLSVDANGQSAAMNVGIIVARQNGKGAVLECVELFWLFVARITEITHTAHEFKTAKKHYLRIWSLIDRTPSLRRLVRNKLGSNSETSIELHVDGCASVGIMGRDCCMGGPKLTFLARSGASGRGLQGEKIVLDEGLYLTPEIMAALVPIQSAQKDPQAWIASTPPEADGSPTLTELRNNCVGEAVTDPPDDTCWMEWSAPEGSDPEDWRATAMANPAQGTRLQHRSILRERRLLGSRSEEYLRERMCYWPQTSAARILDPDAWDALGEYVDPEHPEDAPQISGPYAIGIAASPNLARIWAYIAGDADGGIVQLEQGREFRSTHGVAAWLAAAQARDDGLCAVVIDPKNDAAALLDALAHAGVEVLKPTAGEYAAACVGLAASINGTDLPTVQGEDGEPVTVEDYRHLGEEPLAMAVRVAGKRPIGRLWGWRSTNAAVDAAPLEAATLAAFGLTRNRPDGDGVIIW